MRNFFRELERANNALLMISVSQYILEVAERKCFKRNGELANLPAKDKCPFADFDEAVKAYTLHEERVANRRYETFDEMAYGRRHPPVRAKKLRPRKAR